MWFNALSAVAIGAIGVWLWWALDLRILGAAFVASVALAIIFRISLVMFAFRILLPVLVGAAAVYLYIATANSELFALLREGLGAEGSEAGLFVEIFSGTSSTIYALLVAFMVFNALSEHADINASLEKEAMHLDSISQLLPLMTDGASSNDALVKNLNELLCGYADNVLSKSFTRSGEMVENQAIIDALFEQVYRLRVEDDNDRIALSALIRRVDELEALRAHRVSAMKAKTSPFLTILLIFLSVAVVAPFYLPMQGTQDIAPIAIASLAFCTSFLFVMLMDMTSHFHGFWTVDRTPFGVVHKRISDRLGLVA